MPGLCSVTKFSKRDIEEVMYFCREVVRVDGGCRTISMAFCDTTESNLHLKSCVWLGLGNKSTLVNVVVKDTYE